MKLSNFARNIFTLMIVALSSAVMAQTMPKKYDDACLKAAREQFIICSASAVSQVAKQKCQETLSDEEKKCKIKTSSIEPAITVALLIER